VIGETITVLETKKNPKIWTVGFL